MGRVSDWTLHTGDCLEILPTLEAGSVDSVITDCPYGLKFMGQEWDHGVPGRPFWEACLRVAKPGAYLLAFGGTRTWHRLACAVEDAGWELRDTLLWLYGQGFPKGVDVGKAIDREAGIEREVGPHRVRPDGTTRPNRENWSGANGTVYAQDEWTQTQGGRMGGRESAPATDAARLWDGWHSTLKPGWEPILLAMKPLDGSYARNALEHGVAGLNVDGCRVGITKRVPGSLGTRTGWEGYGRRPGRQGKRATDGGNDPNLGRWPANVVLQHHESCVCRGTRRVKGSNGVRGASTRIYGGGEGFTAATGEPVGYADADGMETVEDWDCHPTLCPVRLLDEQAGDRSCRDGHVDNRFGKFGHANCYGRANGADSPARVYGDSGGPSRFFYCSKASKAERGEGNTHATVKPLALMRWLCRLTKTPTGGVVLDPFAGSGTTLLAAVLEGRKAIGVEVSEEYCRIARKRLAEAQGPLFAHAGGAP
jgi:hypothetical protein